MMLPITRPRCASTVIAAASGTSIWIEQVVTPITKLMARNPAGAIGQAAIASATALVASVARISRRFSTRSHSGTSRNRPAA